MTSAGRGVRLLLGRLLLGRLLPDRLPLGSASLSLAAWLLLALIGASPYAGLLSHHVIGNRGLSPTLTLTLFMTGWLLMTLAMMLPSTLPTLATLPGRRQTCIWLVGYLTVWLELGLIIYGGDLTVHMGLEPRFPAATRWLFPATLLATGIYEFTLWKRRCLMACKARLGTSSMPSYTLTNGLRHGLNCVGGCGALMLAMTAGGVMDSTVMLVLGALIAAEKNTLWGKSLMVPLGTVLCGAAVIGSLHLLGGI